MARLLLLLAAVAGCLGALAAGTEKKRAEYATVGLQAAIEACRAAEKGGATDASGGGAAAGGQPACGRVVVDTPGAYLTASLTLTGCVHLVLPEGVTLLAGDRRADYGPTQTDWYLLRFVNCTGCSLSGGGTIDGRGRLWTVPMPGQGHADPGTAAEQRAALGGALAAEGEGDAWSRLQATARRLQGPEPKGSRAPGLRLPHEERAAMPGRKPVRNWEDASCAKPSECRPRLVGVVDSEGVSISGVRMADPIYWALHVLRSTRVHISDVSIRGDWGIPNNDGIDIDSSSHVTVTGADVDTADDAICLKTTSPGHPLEHVAVSDCTLRSRSSAVKLGSESVAAMRHIRFVRLAIKDSHRGLAIQLRDGGSISDVTFEHVSVSTRLYDPSWWGAAEPISITAVPRTPGGQVGTVSDVAFRDITAVSEGGILLAGGPLGGDAAPSAAAAAADGDACGASGCVTAEQRRQQPYSLQRITLERVRVQLKQRSRWPGGCRDYRPSSNDSGTPSPCAACEGWWPAGLDCAGRKTAPLWVAGAEGVVLHDLRLQHHAPWRADWSGEAWIDPASTRDVSQWHVSVTDADFRRPPDDGTAEE